MSRIIFINQDTGPLLIDILNVFVEKKCEVILYTGKITKTYAELNEKVKVRKLCPLIRNNIFNRLITWSLFFLQCIFILIFDLKSKTRIYFSSNPPFLPFIALLYKTKYDIHVYDVYPNALLALSYVTKESFIYKLFSHFNKIVYNKAENIFTPSEGMKNMLIKYVDSMKIKVIPWWANTSFIKPINKFENKFITKFNLKDKFIVMYSGNLGLTHNIEKILDTAFLMKDEKNIIFVIIGNGPKKKVVDNFFNKNKLKNLLILPYQDVDMLPYSLTSSDVSIILDSFSFKEKNLSTASIPSKTYYLLAAGTAILALADKKSELNNLINRHKIGFVDSNEDNKELIKFIRYCYDDKKALDKMKKNSREVSKMYTVKNAEILYKTIMKK